MDAPFPDPAPVFWHSSQQAAALSRARRDSLRNGRVHHQFHYDTPRQTALWLEVFRQHSPVVGNPAFAELYRTQFARFAATPPPAAPGDEWHVIGLGSGDGRKEAWLLESLRRAGGRPVFTAVDVSATLALQAARAAWEFVPEPPAVVAADLLQFTELPRWLAVRDPTRRFLYTFFGLLPNFSPEEIFPWLRTLLRPGDMLLASAHLAPAIDESDAAYFEGCRRVFPQYDNGATRAWLSAVLQDWGWAEFLTPPEFRLDHAPSGLRGIFASSRWREDRTLAWEGEEIAVRQGEELGLFFSLRYTRARLEKIAAAHGLHAFCLGLTPCGEEGLWRFTLP